MELPTKFYNTAIAPVKFGTILSLYNPREVSHPQLSMQGYNAMQTDIAQRVTCHSERSPQPRRQFSGVVVPQLHPAHSHDLTHKTDFLSFQVFATQVLEIVVSSDYFI